MACQASLLISAFKRPHLLKWGLYSISKQNIPFKIEVIVVNDGLKKDGTEAICRQYQEKLNLKYIFSGWRNLKGEIKWRVPGFAINIAAKRSSGQVLIISCAEMFHLNNTIQILSNSVLANPKLLAIPKGWDDNGSFLHHLNQNDGSYQDVHLEKYGPLIVQMPFLMAVSRQEYFAIGGYDEDFTGIAFDDNDLVGRMLQDGCKYQRTEAKTIHLYHPHLQSSYDPKRYSHNSSLYYSRRGKIVRNKDREWGKLEVE